MNDLSHDDIVVLFLAVASLLTVARIFGEIAKRYNQPAVVGEIIAGIMLGPTVLGATWFAPELTNYLFPSTGPSFIALKGLTTIAVALFLLVAGMEVDLSTIFRQGRTASTVGVCGVAVPFSSGFLLAWLAPSVLGFEPLPELIDPEKHRLIFALFFATAMSIVALPVIAKTLMDLRLYRTDLGMIIIASAIFEDLVGWLVFGVVLGMMSAALSTPDAELGARAGIGITIFLTLLFAAGMLTVGRWAMHRILPWVQAHTSWPGGELGFALAVALFSAAYTEYIGVHAIFGAFLAGVAIGDSTHLREQTRRTIHQFVSFIFAPLFFASIGLRVDFVAHFDVWLVLVVVVVACVGKIVGGGMGARLAGMQNRQALAIGFAMNSRGAMEIILGLLALHFKIIGPRLFVALVVMALFTSIIAGPMMQRILQQKRARRFWRFLHARTFVPKVEAQSRRDVVIELSKVAAAHAGLDAERAADEVWRRELIMSTGLGQGVAVPHARLAGLTAPVIAIGRSKAGIDFNAPDGQPAQLIFLILTPEHDHTGQIEILSDIGHLFAETDAYEKAMAAASYTELLALFRSIGGEE